MTIYIIYIVLMKRMVLKQMADHIYVGITIGPIYATLMRTSTPAGMWFVSTMFSKVSEELCKELVEKGLERKNIFSPYFGENKKLLIPDGIGLYHDRILFFTDSNFILKLRSCEITCVPWKFNNNWHKNSMRLPFLV